MSSVGITFLPEISPLVIRGKSRIMPVSTKKRTVVSIRITKNGNLDNFRCRAIAHIKK